MSGGTGERCHAGSGASWCWRVVACGPGIDRAGPERLTTRSRAQADANNRDRTGRHRGAGRSAALERPDTPTTHSSRKSARGRAELVTVDEGGVELQRTAMRGAQSSVQVSSGTGRCTMRSCGLLLVVLALAVAGGFGRVARAQELSPPYGDPNQVQSVPVRPPTGWKASEGSDRVAVERLFGESERLTRGLEPKRMQTIRIKPDADDAPAGRPR